MGEIHDQLRKYFDDWKQNMFSEPESSDSGSLTPGGSLGVSRTFYDSSKDAELQQQFNRLLQLGPLQNQQMRAQLQIQFDNWKRMQDYLLEHGLDPASLSNQARMSDNKQRLKSMMINLMGQGAMLPGQSQIDAARAQFTGSPNAVEASGWSPGSSVRSNSDAPGPPDWVKARARSATNPNARGGGVRGSSGGTSGGVLGALDQLMGQGGVLSSGQIERMAADAASQAYGDARNARARTANAAASRGLGQDPYKLGELMTGIDTAASGAGARAKSAAQIQNAMTLPGIISQRIGLAQMLANLDLAPTYDQYGERIYDIPGVSQFDPDKKPKNRDKNKVWKRGYSAPKYNMSGLMG